LLIDAIFRKVKQVHNIKLGKFAVIKFIRGRLFKCSVVAIDCSRGP
jgi:hypothetical protein